MADRGARDAFSDAEAATATAMERLVATEGFAELLARTVGNVVAVQRLTAKGLDLIVSKLRLAGRRDLVRLGRQIGRAEDKLERVLQEVETLQPAVPPATAPAVGRARAALGGAAASTLFVAAAIIALDPPKLPDSDSVVVLAVAALALALTTAWLTLVLAGERRPKETK